MELLKIKELYDISENDKNVVKSTKGYKLGDEITWHIYGDNNYYTSKIIGFNKDPQNQNISMTKKYLENLGINYKPDALYTNIDLSKTKEIKNIEAIQDIDSLKEWISKKIFK